MKFPEISLDVDKKLAEYVDENDVLLNILSTNTEEKNEPKVEIPKTDTVEIQDVKPKEKKLKTDKEYQDDANTIIFLIDGLGALFLPNMYMKKLFSKSEKEVIKKVKTGELKELPVLIKKKIDEMEILKQNIPFKQYEIDLLKHPLSAVLKKHQINSSTEFLLVGALLTIMLPRMSTFFNNDLI